MMRMARWSKAYEERWGEATTRDCGMMRSWWSDAVAVQVRCIREGLALVLCSRGCAGQRLASEVLVLVNQRGRAAAVQVVVVSSSTGRKR